MSASVTFAEEKSIGGVSNKRRNADRYLHMPSIAASPAAEFATPSRKTVRKNIP